MSTEIVPVANYALMQSDVEQTLAHMQENLDGERISQWDLPRIQIPAGGGLTWEVPSLTGGESSRDLVGIPVFQSLMRSYWEDPNPVEGTPPDCSSPDAKLGYGNPGGNCETCPLAQFGSAQNGTGQACKLRRMIFLLRENDTIPVLLSLPPTSVKPWRNFLLQASSHGPYYGMQVGLTLKKASSNGYTYSVIVPRMVSMLEGDALAKATTYHQMFSDLMAGDYGRRMAEQTAAETVEL